MVYVKFRSRVLWQGKQARPGPEVGPGDTEETSMAGARVSE